MGATQSNDDFFGYLFGSDDGKSTNKTASDIAKYRRTADDNVLKINGKELPYNKKKWAEIITERMNSDTVDELTIEVNGKPGEDIEKKLNEMGIRINYVNNATNKMTGGNNNSTDSVFSTTSDSISDSDDDMSSLSSPSQTVAKNDKVDEVDESDADKKKKKRVQVEDENDSPNEDLVVEDEVSEDGIILDDDEIHTSDIKKMQSRLFHSDTSDDMDDMNDNDIYTDGYTDMVKKAMKDVKRKSNIYDSEEKNILDVNSDSDEYMKRPINKNMKYQ